VATLNEHTILLAFENDADRVAVRRHIADCTFAVLEADSIGHALQLLRRKAYACAILEFPDRRTLDTMDRNQTGTPIIWIVTDMKAAGEQSVLPEGLQNYWHRDDLSPALFFHCLPLIIDRQKLQRELNESRKPFEKRDLDQEIASLMSWYYRTTATAQTFGLNTVREVAPDKFSGMVDLFGGLIDQSLEEKVFRVPNQSSLVLHELAQKLGLLNAGPRDIIEMYAMALRKKVTPANQLKNRAYVDASRTLALELMGHLVTYYRNLARLAMRREAIPEESREGKA
jgi:hypothetical protein